MGTITASKLQELLVTTLAKEGINVFGASIRLEYDPTNQLDVPIITVTLDIAAVVDFGVVDTESIWDPFANLDWSETSKGVELSEEIDFPLSQPSKRVEVEVETDQPFSGMLKWLMPETDQNTG